MSDAALGALDKLFYVIITTTTDYFSPFETDNKWKCREINKLKVGNTWWSNS